MSFFYLILFFYFFIFLFIYSFFYLFIHLFIFLFFCFFIYFGWRFFEFLFLLFFFFSCLSRFSGSPSFSSSLRSEASSLIVFLTPPSPPPSLPPSLPRLLIASFNQYDMIEVNAHRLAYPSTLAAVQTCIIVDGVPISFAKEYAALGVKWCSIGDGCVLPSFLEDAHTRGIGVMVWTVNNPR